MKAHSEPRRRALYSVTQASDDATGEEVPQLGQTAGRVPLIRCRNMRLRARQWRGGRDNSDVTVCDGDMQELASDAYFVCEREARENEHYDRRLLKSNAER